MPIRNIIPVVEDKTSALKVKAAIGSFSSPRRVPWRRIPRLAERSRSLLACLVIQDRGIANWTFTNVQVFTCTAVGKPPTTGSFQALKAGRIRWSYAWRNASCWGAAKAVKIIPIQAGINTGRLWVHYPKFTPVGFAELNKLAIDIRYTSLFARRQCLVLTESSRSSEFGI